MDGLNRHVERKIQRLLKSFPIVAILGPRQCGKSTLAKKMTQSHWKYFDCERHTVKNQIQNDPDLFFQENPEHIILDEV
jgi:predicted AAA+ superfamily ATPase